VTVARNEYGLYMVPKKFRHRPVARALLLGKVYESKTIDFIRSAQPQGDIVHAGTFIGDFLPALSLSRTDRAKVWAFEPNSESHRCAEAVIALNGLQNVALFHAGLSSQTEKGTLATTTQKGLPAGGGSRIINDVSKINGRATEQIDLLTIDQVVDTDRRVSLIQLDVEGFEQQALSGAMQTIRRCRPLLVVESMPEQEWLDQNLAPLGYDIQGAQRVSSNLVFKSG
jgi:FkbM family methyltransferase